MMPISAPGSNKSLATAGFTLIEMAVVLLLMEIVSTLVVVNMVPGDRQTLQAEGQKLADLLAAASMEAQTSGRTMAWVSNGRRYAFLVTNDQGDWVTDDDSFWRGKSLPDGISLQSRAIDQPGYDNGARLVFHASGVNAPFRVWLHKGHASAMITSDMMNHVAVGDARDSE